MPNYASGGNLGYLAEKLAFVASKVGLANSVNLMSVNIYMETFCAELLGRLYGWQLRNANADAANNAGFDLIDEGSRVLVQVTSDTRPAKMNATFKKKGMDEYAKEGYTVYFAYVGIQDKNVKKRRPEGGGKFSFDAKEHTILFSDILRRFQDLGKDAQDDLIEVVRRELGDGYCYHDESARRRLEMSVAELGPRYTSDLNIATGTARILDAFVSGDGFWQTFESLKAKACEAVTAACDALPEALLKNSEWADAVRGLRRACDDLASCGRSSSFEDIDQALQGMSDAFVRGHPDELAGARAYAFRFLEEQGRAWYWVDALGRHCDGDARSALGSGVLVVTGAGGVGKSHAIADACLRAERAGHAVVLLLGQRFMKHPNPLQQMMEQAAPEVAGVPYIELLDELERCGESRGKCSLLAIDALNEGEGPLFWSEHLGGLVAELGCRPHVKLLLSARGEDQERVIPDGLFDNPRVAHVVHRGFRGLTREAMGKFCSHYGLTLPSLPHFGTAFENPLFLRMACQVLEGEGETAFRATRSFSDVVANYLAYVNRTLSAKGRLDYDGHVNAVERAVKALALDDGFENGRIPYDRAFDAVAQSVCHVVADSRKMLQELIGENVLNCYRDCEDGQYVIFAFERVGHCVWADAMIDRAGGRAGALREDERLSSAVRAGELEALAAIVPERLGVEVFDVLPPSQAGSAKAADAFVSTMRYRAAGKIWDSTRRFVDEAVLSRPDVARRFFGELLMCSGDPGCAFNGKFLDGILRGMDMRMRDGLWTAAISVSCPEALEFVRWAWASARELDDATAEGVCLGLTWALSSTNPRLRDSATKALASCLQGRPELAGKVAASLDDIDDAYIVERVAAALLGAAVHSEKDAAWSGVAEGLYDVVFGGAEAYPHVMARMYARECISALARKNGLDAGGFPLMQEVEKCPWYGETPSAGDVSGLLGEAEGRYGADSDEYRGAWKVVASMLTEGDHELGPLYGDFGRYVFGPAVRPWRSRFTEQELSWLVMKRVIAGLYDPEVHGAADRIIAPADAGRIGWHVERIGKKYQRMETAALIARLIDNFEPERVWARGAGEPLEGLALEREMIGLRDIDPTDLRCPHGSGQGLWSGLPHMEQAIGEGCEWAAGIEAYEKLGECRQVVVGDVPYAVLAARYSHERGEGERSGEVFWEAGSCFADAGRAQEFADVWKDVGTTCSCMPICETEGCFLHDFYEGTASRALEEAFAADSVEGPGFVRGVVREYEWGGFNDASIVDGGVSVFVPCRELVDGFGLMQVGHGEWVREHDGKEVVCYDTGADSRGSHLLLFRADLLEEFCSERGVELVVGEYFEQRSEGGWQRWWQVVTGKHPEYEVMLIDSENGFEEIGNRVGAEAG